jgi:hypothetical protein
MSDGNYIFYLYGGLKTDVNFKLFLMLGMEEWNDGVVEYWIN